MMPDSYNEAQQRLQKIEPWVAFIVDVEGSELGDYLRELEQAFSYANSAAYYDHANTIVGLMESIVENAKVEAVGGWFSELIEYAQIDHERYMEQFTPKHRPDTKGPQQRLEELLAAEAQ